MEPALLARRLLETIGAGRDSTGNTHPVIIRLKNRDIHQQCYRHLALLPSEQLVNLRLIHGLRCHLPKQVIAELQKSESVLSVEKDHPVRLHNTPTLQAEQVIPWGIAAIRAPRIWGETVGRDVNVAVLDTGIAQHPDLIANIAGGVNILNRRMPPLDDNGHGTHVSGTIAAVNNTFGVVGAAPSARLHAVKAFDQNGSANTSDIIAGIEWAIDEGMDVINMSFGTNEPSKAMHAAIRAAARAGILMVASAGNDGKANSVDYPARFPEVIAVAASTKSNRIASFSSRGKQVDVAAPGKDILSTLPGNEYGVESGTSMATPHVVGLSADLLSLFPQLTNRQIAFILKRTALPLPRTSRLAQGAGRIDAVRALRLAQRRMS